MNRRNALDQKQSKTRAEIVRERRAQKSKSHTEKKAYRAHSPAMNMTPVTFRQADLGTPVVQRTKSQVRRQYSIPLKSRGAELRIPSLPIFKPGWKILSGFLLIFLISTLFLTMNSGVFNVNELNIEGLQRISAADISKVLDIKDKPIFLVDPGKVMDTLVQEFPELTDIQINVEFPSLVHISLTERVPVLEWNYGNLKIWIDQEGVIIPPRGEGSGVLTVISDSGPPRLPLDEEMNDDSEEMQNSGLINTANFNGPVNKELINQLLLLKTYLPENTSISYSQTDGYGWHDTQNDWNIYLGYKLENLDQKFIVYHKIVDMINTENLDVSVINVGNLHNPYFKPEH